MKQRHMRRVFEQAVRGMVKSPRLARLIHLALITHLLIGGSLLALIIGISTYYMRSDEIAEDVLAAVKHEAEVFQTRIRQLAAERRLSLLQASRAVLEETQPASRVQQIGRFLSFELCEANGSTTLLWSDPSRPAPVQDRCIPRSDEPARPSGDSGAEVVRHSGQVYVLIRTSISIPISFGSERSERPQLAEREAHITFLLSDAALKRVEREAVNRALLAAVIVLLTTLAVYPGVLLLVRRIEKLSEKLLFSNLEMMQVLGSAVAQRDNSTDEHNYRVSLYSIRLAESLNLGPAEMRGLLKGAFLHDVGKIGIPDRILRKPGPLSEDEMKTMRDHVPLGLDIIVRSSWLADAADVVGCHHERVDGTGYPKGISGEEIPLTARIFAIADVFDALCSERPYKKALSAETAISIMRYESGGRFDQQLFAVFERMAMELHARYANCRSDVLRDELDAVHSRVFLDRLYGLVR